jgi:endonuclease III
MEQMTELLKAMQEKMDYNLKEIRASQDHLKEEMLAKMEAKVDTNQEKLDAWIAEMGFMVKKNTACQEAMEACLEKANESTSEEIMSEAEHKEVPKEEAAVETFGALKDIGTGI